MVSTAGKQAKGWCEIESFPFSGLCGILIATRVLAASSDVRRAADYRIFDQDKDSAHIHFLH
jgi:hypothetical protein